jgi:hypothetical protein
MTIRTAPPVTTTLPELVARMAALHTLPVDERVIEARRLAVEAPSVLGATADAGVACLVAQQGATYQSVAERLGVSHARINGAVQRHRRSPAGGAAG